MRLFKKSSRLSVCRDVRQAARAAVEPLERRQLMSVAGDFDPTFSEDGRVTIAFPKVTVQPGDPNYIPDFIDNGVELRGVDSQGGLTVVVGNHRTGSSEAGSTFDSRELAVARLLSNGSLDTSFGSGGTLYSKILKEAYDVFVQNDGKVVIAGLTVSPSNEENYAVIRLNANGEVDTSFGGGDGMTTFDFIAQRVRPTTGGKIVVGGADSNAQDAGVFAAAQLLPDGSIDTSFGDGGVTVTNVTLGTTPALLAVQPNGKILLASDQVRTTTPTFTIDGVVVRLNANGNLDDTFSDDGAAFVNIQDVEDIGGIDVGSNGTIYAAFGRTTPSTQVLTTLNSNGNQGALFEALDARAYVTTVRAAFNNSGKIIVYGQIETSPGSSDFRDAVIRYNADGKLDRTFGTSGKGYVLTVNSRPIDGFFAGDLQNDMKIIAASGSQGELTGTYEVQVSRLLSVGDTTVPPTTPPTVPPTVPPGVPPTVPPGIPPTVPPGVPPTVPPGVPPTVPPGVPPTVPPPLPPSVGGTNPQGTLSGTIVTKLPSGVIAGEKVRGGKATVAVTNPTTTLVKGKVTVDLLVSADATLDSGDATVITRVKNLKLKPGQTKKVVLPIKALPNVESRQYQAIARITAADQTQTAVPEGTSFLLSAPFIDLTPTIRRDVSSNVAIGGKASASIVVQNAGNILAKGPFSVTLVASTDNTVSDNDTTLITKSANLNLKPGKSKTFNVKFALPTTLTAGPYYLAVKADSANNFAETDELTNSIVSSSPFTIG